MDLVLRVDSEDSTDNVFEIEIIIARKRAVTEEDTVPSPYPYKNSDIFKYICKSVKSCLKVMLDNEIPGWRKGCYCVYEYLDGTKIEQPIRAYMYDYKWSLIDEEDYSDLKTSKKIFADLDKSRNFQPGEIIEFIDGQNIYTGIVYDHFWNKKNGEGICCNNNQRDESYASLDTYTVIVSEHEDGPSFYYPDRLRIIKKIPYIEGNSYHEELKHYYNVLKGKLDPMGQPL